MFSTMFEKRKFVRFVVYAFIGYKSYCNVIIGENEYLCRIIDISLGGMRLMFIKERAKDIKGKDIIIKNTIEEKINVLNGVKGVVRWQNEDELGVMFNETLQPEQLEIVLNVLC